MSINYPSGIYDVPQDADIENASRRSSVRRSFAVRGLSLEKTAHDKTFYTLENASDTSISSDKGQGLPQPPSPSPSAAAGGVTTTPSSAAQAPARTPSQKRRARQRASGQVASADIAQLQQAEAATLTSTGGIPTVTTTTTTPSYASVSARNSRSSVASATPSSNSAALPAEVSSGAHSSATAPARPLRDTPSQKRRWRPFGVDLESSIAQVGGQHGHTTSPPYSEAGASAGSGATQHAPAAAHGALQHEDTCRGGGRVSRKASTTATTAPVMPSEATHSGAGSVTSGPGSNASLAVGVDASAPTTVTPPDSFVRARSPSQKRQGRQRHAKALSGDTPPVATRTAGAGADEFPATRDSQRGGRRPHTVAQASPASAPTRRDRSEPRTQAPAATIGNGAFPPAQQQQQAAQRVPQGINNAQPATTKAKNNTSTGARSSTAAHSATASAAVKQQVPGPSEGQPPLSHAPKNSSSEGGASTTVTTKGNSNNARPASAAMGSAPPQSAPTLVLLQPRAHPHPPVAVQSLADTTQPPLSPLSWVPADYDFKTDGSHTTRQQPSAHLGIMGTDLASTDGSVPPSPIAPLPPPPSAARGVVNNMGTVSARSAAANSRTDSAALGGRGTSTRSDSFPAPSTTTGGVHTVQQQQHLPALVTKTESQASFGVVMDTLESIIRELTTLQAQTAAAAAASVSVALINSGPTAVTTTAATTTPGSVPTKASTATQAPAGTQARQSAHVSGSSAAAPSEYGASGVNSAQHAHNGTQHARHSVREVEAIHAAVAPLVRGLSAATVNKIVDDVVRNSQFPTVEEMESPYEVLYPQEGADHDAPLHVGESAAAAFAHHEGSHHAPIPPRYSDTQLRAHNKKSSAEDKDDSDADTRLRHRKVHRQSALLLGRRRALSRFVRPCWFAMNAREPYLPSVYQKCAFTTILPFAVIIPSLSVCSHTLRHSHPPTRTRCCSILSSTRTHIQLHKSLQSLGMPTLSTAAAHGANWLVRAMLKQGTMACLLNSTESARALHTHPCAYTHTDEKWYTSCTPTLTP